MNGLDANARRINAITAARRRNPIAAGYDDGEHAGFRTQGRVQFKDWADPKWAANKQYRDSFKKGFKAGRREWRWVQEDMS